MNTAVFERLSNKLRHLPMRDIVERAADRQEDLMVELNLKQLDEGIRADGQRIEPEYAAYTVSRKKKVGQPTDRVTLKDSGDFYNAERVKRYPGKYELVNYDPKSESLQTRYGYQILGLTTGNLVIVKKAMVPLMIVDTKRVLKTNLI